MLKVNVWTAVAVLFVLLFLWQWQCNKEQTVTQTKTVTVRVPYDTIIYPESKGLTMPAKVIEHTVAFPVYIDTGSVRQEVVHDVTEAATDYFSEHIDSFKFNSNYGSVTFVDTTQYNRVKPYPRAIFNLSLPVTTTVQTVNRLQVWAGVEATYPIGGGINLGVKTPANKYYELGTGIINGKQYYKAGLKTLIKL